MTEREIIIGLVMFIIGKVIGFGFGWLNGRKKEVQDECTD